MRLHPLYCQLGTAEATLHVRAAKNTGLPLPEAPHQVRWYPFQRGRPDSSNPHSSPLQALFQKKKKKKQQSCLDLTLSHSTFTTRAGSLTPCAAGMNIAPQRPSPQLAVVERFCAGRGKPRRLEATTLPSALLVNQGCHSKGIGFTGNRAWVNSS